MKIGTASIKHTEYLFPIVKVESLSSIIAVLVLFEKTKTPAMIATQIITVAQMRINFFVSILPPKLSKYIFKHKKSHFHGNYPYLTIII